MQVLFCHDGPIRRDESEEYFGIAHNNDLFKRYRCLAENVAVAIRVEKLMVNREKYSKINLKNFKVYTISNPSSVRGIINRNKINEQIKRAVTESDYIIARLPSFIGNVAIKYAKKMDKPYLVELVACPWDAFWNHSVKGKFIAPYMYLKTKKLVKDSNYVIYVTNEFLQKRYPTNGKNINCSNVVLNEIDDLVLERRLQKIDNKSANEKIIIGTTAAVNVRYKGQQYIIEALGELKKSGILKYEYQLVGAGDQAYLKSIAKKHNVEENVKFLGPKKHEEVFEWLDTIDIYAQPSRQEGLPRALIEAMSRGLPAIGAKTAGIPELISSNCLFTNSKTNISEIISILSSMDKNQFRNQSINNFTNSKQYELNVISYRRNEFYKCFKYNSK